MYKCNFCKKKLTSSFSLFQIILFIFSKFIVLLCTYIKTIFEYIAETTYKKMPEQSTI